MAVTTLQIDLVSDVSCPWCVIGYHSLALALEQLEPEIQAEITWHPFELNPQMSVQGQHLGEHLQHKYGMSAAELAQGQQMITARGRALGFSFNYQPDGRIYNTFDAHRLLYWARQQRRQTPLQLALFALYFSEGGNPSAHAELLQAVQQAGLPQQEAAQVLASGKYAEEVRAEEAKYVGMGVQAVPTFFFNGQHQLTGGLPVEQFVEKLRQLVVAGTRGA